MSVIAVYLIFSMLAVLWLDTTRYTIPNWLVGGVLLAYPFAVFASPLPVDWQMAVAGAAVVLVLGYIVFTLRLMGGGDVKLIAALALWVGLKHLADFVFIVALLGGVLSIFLWAFRKLLPYIPGKPKKESMPRILREGEPVPYGIAIALGFLIMLWTGKIALLA
ncbi:MAG: hypothetical protein EBX37_08925 [Alphaproteobacteria bacterium]|nr:hypothetical protein [Alphaproteobacteria bacterium]